MAPLALPGLPKNSSPNFSKAKNDAAVPGNLRMASSSPTSLQAPMTIYATKSFPTEFRGIPRQKLHSSTKKVESTVIGKSLHKRHTATTTLYILN